MNNKDKDQITIIEAYLKGTRALEEYDKKKWGNTLLSLLL